MKRNGNFPLKSSALALRDAQKGAAAIEFALILPILLMIFLGAVEMARFSLINLKLDMAAASMSDLLSQEVSVSEGKLDALIKAGQEIFKPYDLIEKAGVVYSSVESYEDGAGACPEGSGQCISWQYFPASTNLIGVSRIGNEGGAPTLPDGYQLEDNQGVIVTEITYQYSPILDATATFIPSLKTQYLYKISLFTPRTDKLAELE